MTFSIYGSDQSSEAFPIDPSATQIPFWFLNGEVDGAEWCRQIDEMASQGVCQAMPHPRFGMDRRDYLTPKYWQAFDALVQHAAESGFTLHLYDEYNWSSGTAGGRVTQARDYCALGIGMRCREVCGETRVTFDEWARGMMGWGKREAYLGVWLIPHAGADKATLDLAGARMLPCPENEAEVVSIDIPDGEWMAVVIYTIRTQSPSLLRTGNGGIIDYLNPNATAEFIKLTHEEYAKRYQRHFGTVIPSIFYDESGPYASGAFTWTGNFAVQFTQRKGYDLVQSLPCLFFDCGVRAEKVRFDYWDVLSALFAENHIGQMADWCERHGLKLTGHTYEEPDRWMIAGDPMRSLRRQHWVGFDSLGGYKPYHFMKLASSVAHLKGSDVLLCESLGLLGLWGCSPRMMREAYNQLAILGVTHQVPHAFFQTVDNPKVECPPSFFEHNPYWKYYRQVADLTARQCMLNRNKAHVADVAVFYPLTSWWADAVGGRGYGYPWQIVTEGSDPSRADRVAFEHTLDCLMQSQIDADVIDGTGVQQAQVDGSALSLAREKYSVLVLPPMRTVRLADMQQFLDFACSGVVLIVIGRWPDVSAENGRQDPALSRIVDELKRYAHSVNAPEDVPALVRRLIDPDVILIDQIADVDISHWQDDTCHQYAVYNHAPCRRTIRLSLRVQDYRFAEYVCPEDGSVREIATVAHADRTEVKLMMESMEMGYLRFDKSMPCAGSISARVQECVQKTEIEGEWEFLPVGDALDREWRIDLTETELQLPIFKSRELKTQPETEAEAALWTEWMKPEFDDHDWETVHCQLESLLYECDGSRLFRAPIPLGAVALRLPLPLEGEYVVYLNGKLVCQEMGHAGLAEGWLPLPDDGDILSGGVIAIECASMAPGFGIRNPLTFLCRPVSVGVGSWTENRLDWYSGRCLYRKSIRIDQVDAGRRLLDLGDVRECVEIWVNGKLVGVRLWPPYQVDITPFVVSGDNEIVLVVCNLLSNRFAWDDWGTRGKGEMLPSGLLGPVTLAVLRP